MKLLIASLFFSSLAIAGDASIFVGKYSLAPQPGCTMNEGDTKPARVYAHLERNSYHNKLQSLSVDVYSDESDASGEVILLESGSFQTVGTSVESHGKVTDTVKAKWTNSKTLVTSVTTERPSMNYVQTMVYEIKATAKEMIIKTYAGKKLGRALISNCTFERK